MNKIKSDDSESKLPLNVGNQEDWDLPIRQKRLTSLISDATTPQDKARLLAVSSVHASDWLNAIPIPSLGLKMNNSQMRISCALRLGSKICLQHQCICGAQVLSDGHHGLSCKKSAGRFARHSQVNDIIKRALQSSHIPATLEPTGVSRTDGKRPDGLTIFPWKKGKLMVWDYTCSDTLAPSYIKSSSQESGKVALTKENNKLSKYSNLIDQYEVIPVCVETLGPWGPNGLKLVQEIGKKIRDETGERRSTSFLLQSISMAVQRGNCASIMGTVGFQKKLEEIYYL